ncbi:MAG: hypothetical protein A3A81_00815 [Omnitrophica bacterium RIFCSPLOWO2_01_FULL_45_10b]|nr:MAG: hypothetical protein A3A81_00815 [Omnitrophica bacterium RIFCSPLOWO2_01_FULL_45_10b]
MKWAIACFKFFASLRLAVALLVILGIVFGAGTFVESHYGTDAAQVLIYRTHWLGFLLILLAFNLLASALDRIPWKKKHTGFLTTHLGIILLLSGALISQAFGIEGQLAIPEGKTESRMTLPDPLIQILAVDSGQRWIFPMKRQAFPWKGQIELIADTDISDLIQVRLLTDYPKAKLVETVQPSDTGSPALHMALKGSRASVDQWLFLENPSRNLIHLGPATIRFEAEPLKNQPEENFPELGFLQFQFDNRIGKKIPLDQKSIGKTFALEKMPYQVQVKRIFKHAIVEGNQLMEQKSGESNPAVELILEGGGLSERHTVFAKFPEFPTLHGLAPSAARVRISYEVPDFSKTNAANELRFIRQPKGLPKYQTKKGDEIKEGQLELGKEIETGWMDFKFAVDQYLEYATLIESYSPLPSYSQSVEAISTVEVEFEKAGEKKTMWLPQGEIVYVPLGGADYHVMYGLKTKPMGFQIELVDFMIDTDPGTNQPASFKSAVKLKDLSLGINRDLIIQMNRPLKHRGFKVYQSAYQQEAGQPEVSIFTVARDPGNPLKYTGAVIMIAGILMLFYVKPFSTLKGSDPKLRNK